MEEKELKALTGQIQEELKTIRDVSAELRKEIDKKAPMERIEELINKHAAGELNLNTLSDQFDALELKLKDRAYGGRPASLFGDFEKAYKEKGQKLVAKNGKPIPGSHYTFEMDINPRTLLKASTIDETTELSDSDMGTAVIVPMRTPGVEKLPDRMPALMDIVQRGTTGSNRVTWVERSARTEGTSTLAEAAQYPQSDMTYIQKSAEVEKIGTFIKVTGEALEDWPELLTQIRNELFPSVERKLDQQIYSGTGTTPQLDGIITSAQAYSTTTHDGKIVSPNSFDAIVASGTQIKEYNFMPNYSLMSVGNHDQMLMNKDANNRYDLPAFVSIVNGVIYVNGIRVIPNKLITDGDICTGDFSKVTLYIKRGIEIKIWDQDSTDPEYDLKTITASVRAAVKYPAPSAYAFVYDTIADIKSAIAELVG